MAPDYTKQLPIAKRELGELAMLIEGTIVF